jgi:hypothetical protein
MTYLRCPECESEDVRVEAYDFGRDPETGYSDSGERGICLRCHENAELEEFEREESDDVEDERYAEADRQFTGAYEES